MTDGGLSEPGRRGCDLLGPADFSPQTRVVADAEYLSSYPYREAFTENFNQAVSSDILSMLYGVHEANGFDGVGAGGSIPGVEDGVPAATPTTAGDTGGAGEDLPCAVAGLQHDGA